jgi:hypothetical protein
MRTGSDAPVSDTAYAMPYTLGCIFVPDRGRVVLYIFEGRSVPLRNGETMAQNLSRRKYSALVKYLTGVMEDKQASQRSRISAAFRLCDLLLTHDARKWKLEDRAYRAELRAQGQTVPEPVELETAESDTVQAVLDSVLARKGSTDVRAA